MINESANWLKVFNQLEIIDKPLFLCKWLKEDQG
jgi:hypothetical protein